MAQATPQSESNRRTDIQEAHCCVVAVGDDEECGSWLPHSSSNWTSQTKAVVSGGLVRRLALIASRGMAPLVRHLKIAINFSPYLGHRRLFLCPDERTVLLPCRHGHGAYLDREQTSCHCTMRRGMYSNLSLRLIYSHAQESPLLSSFLSKGSSRQFASVRSTLVQVVYTTSHPLPSLYFLLAFASTSSSPSSQAAEILSGICDELGRF